MTPTTQQVLKTLWPQSIPVADYDKAAALVALLGAPLAKPAPTRVTTAPKAAPANGSAKVTPAQAAEIAGVTRDTIYRWIDTKAIKARKLSPRKTLVEVASLPSRK